MERAERLRLTWIEAYRKRGDAGAVCRRFGISRPTLRKWLRRFEANGNAGLRALSRRPHRSLKIGALVKISVRRVHVTMASACPYQHEFALAHALLRRAGA